MNKNLPSKNKATVCVNKVCATVEGDTAKFVNAMAVTLTLIAFAVAINKLLK